MIEVSLWGNCVCLKMCQLLLVVVFVDEGSIYCVVVVLNMMQLVVLKLLCEFEELIGVVLFECLLCGMWLMLYGDVLICYVCVVFGSFDQVCEELVVLKVGYFGYVVVGVIMLLVLWFVLLVVVVVKGMYVGLYVLVEIDISNVLFEYFVQEKIDIVFGWLFVEYDKLCLCYELLIGELVVVVVWFGYLLFV